MNAKLNTERQNESKIDEIVTHVFIMWIQMWIPDRNLWPLHVLIFCCQRCQWIVHIRCYALWLHAYSTLRMFSTNFDSFNSFCLCTRTVCFSISVWHSYSSSMVVQWNARTHVFIPHRSPALMIFFRDELSAITECERRFVYSIWPIRCHRPSVCQRSRFQNGKRTSSVIQPTCGICHAWSHGRENELG